MFVNNYIRIVELVLERVKRRVEMGKDVVVLLDFIICLVRVYNVVMSLSGKVLSGGVDVNVLYRFKCFFGVVRNIEEGGSLMIIVMVLIEMGFRMDEVIFEEFKGIGNSEIVLVRNIVDRRIYLVFDILKFGI